MCKIFEEIAVKAAREAAIATSREERTATASRALAMGLELKDVAKLANLPIIEVEALAASLTE